MAIVPEPLHSTAAEIYRSYERSAETGNRPHLGASLIGHPCERYLWLTFRWVEDKKFDGRMLRLFRAGHDFEPRIVAELRRIGVEVHDVNPEGKQWEVWDLGGHFGGHMDGAAKGFAEAPKTWALLEFKTHNAKSFAELCKVGVLKAKPQHYAQMQTYMGLTGMERAMYIAENKDTSELYTEWVHFDAVEFARLKARAERVINAAEPPLRISQDPSWYVCKMCDFHSHCHGDAAPQVNCRTCAHSTPFVEDGEGGEWVCESKRNTITLETQRTGCGEHRYIPILLERFATFKDVDAGAVIYTTPTGEFANGDSDQGCLSSHEIRNCEQKVMLADAGKLKKELVAVGFVGAKVVA
jgi:hypothetical protein